MSSSSNTKMAQRKERQRKKKAGSSSSQVATAERKAAASLSKAATALQVEAQRHKGSRVPLPSKLQTSKADDPYVRDLLHAVFSPRSAPGDIRLSDAYDTEPTAVLNPFSIGDVPFAKTSAVPDPSYSSLLPANEALIVLCPSVLQNVIIFDPNIAMATSTYTMALAMAADIPRSSLVQYQATGSYDALPLCYWNYTNGQKWHGNMLAVNVHGEGDDKYTWFSQGDTLTFSATSLNAGQLNIVVRKWEDGHVCFKFETALIFSAAENKTVSFPLDVHGWYTFGFQAESGFTVQNVTGSVAYWPKSGRMCFRMAQSLDTTIASFTDFRQIGQSLLATNIAPELQRGGAIAQCQLGMGDAWWNYLPRGPVANGTFGAESVFEQVGSLRTADGQRDAKKGSYVWRKPSSPLWSSYTSEFSVDAGVLVDTHVPLVPKTGSYVLWTADISPADSGIAQQFRYTTATYLEAKTTDLTRPVGISRGAPIAVLDAQAVLRLTSQYSENPLHVMAIIDAIRRGVSTVANMIATGAPAVARGVAKAGEIAGYVRDAIS